jgi:hypothetical protein
MLNLLNGFLLLSRLKIKEENHPMAERLLSYFIIKKSKIKNKSIMRMVNKQMTKCKMVEEQSKYFQTK